MQRFAQSSNLVAIAFLTQGRYTNVYTLWRWLEQYDAPVVQSNAELGASLGLSESFVRRCLKLFDVLALLRAEYAINGDKRSRRLYLAREFGPWTVRALKNIRRGTIVLELAKSQLVHESGKLVNCAEQTFSLGTSEGVPPSVTAKDEGGKETFEKETTEVQSSVSTSDQPQVKDTDCKESQSEVESDLPRDAHVGNTARAPIRTKKTATSRPPRGRHFASWPAPRQAAVSHLIDLWRELFDYARAQHTDDRRAKVNARLEEGYSVEDLEQVLRIAVNDPWWRGHNDRQTPYDDVIHLFRTGSRVDQFLARAKRGLTGKPRTVDRLRPDLAVSSKPVEEELL